MVPSVGSERLVPILAPPGVQSPGVTSDSVCEAAYSLIAGPRIGSVETHLLWPTSGERKKEYGFVVTYPRGALCRERTSSAHSSATWCLIWEVNYRKLH